MVLRLAVLVFGLLQFLTIPTTRAAGLVNARGAEGGADIACERPVLTLDEAAELLRIDVEPLRTLASSGTVPGRRLGTQWRFNCGYLLAWLAGEARLTTPAFSNESATDDAEAPGGDQPLDPAELAIVVGAGVGTGDDAVNNAEGSVEGEAIGQAPESPTAEDVFLRGQRVLLAPHTFALDVGQFYSESNGAVLSVVDDALVLGTLELETFVTTAQARFGVYEETEVFASASYFSSDSDLFFDSRRLAESSESDFGPVRLGVRRTLLREAAGRPSIIGTLDLSIPTNDAGKGIGAGVSFVKSVDPAALFASISYRHIDVDETADLALLEAAERLDTIFGFALALNDTLSVNASLAATFTSATQFAQTELRQRDSYGLQFGMTSLLSDGLFIEPTLSFRLGGPDDGFAFGLSVFRYPR